MEITLSKNWKIRTLDSRNLLLEEGSTERGYFSSLEDGLQSYLNQKILRMDANSIEELLHKIEDLKESLSEVLTPLKLKVVKENETRD